MKTDEHGIPHNRSRVYIVGIRAVATGRRFEWPAPLKVKPSLKYFLDDAPVKNGARKLCYQTLTNRRNWDAAQAKFKKLGADFESEACLVDLHAAKRFANATVDKMPCLTASRGEHGGYYLTNQDRMTSVEELARLQGWTTDDAKRLKSSGQSANKLGKALGNAMSVNVLYRVLPRALYAAGLLVSKADDVYKRELCDLKQFRKRLLPDALHYDLLKMVLRSE